jgi:hypothetical protein
MKQTGDYLEVSVVHAGTEYQPFMLEYGKATFAEVFVTTGNRYYGVDASLADSFWIYDNATNTIIDADNPIVIGTDELVTAYVDSCVLSQDAETLGTQIAAALADRFSTGDYAMGALKGIGGTAYADTIVDASISTSSAVSITMYGTWAGVPSVVLEAGRAIVTSTDDADSTVMRVSGYAYIVKYAP